MTTPSSEVHTTDLREYIRVIRARKLQIAAVTMAVVLGVLFVAFRQTPIYEGRAKVVVRPIQNVAGGLSVPINPNLDTERQLILSQAVPDHARKSEHITTPSEVLLSHLNVQVLGDTE